MKFIDENANLGLFILIVIVAAAVVMLTIFYQDNFTDINTKYNTKIKELNQTFQDLLGTKSALNETAEKLALKARREEDLSKKFTNVKDERYALKNENEDLRQVVQEQSDSIRSLNSTVSTLKIQLTAKTERVESLEKSKKLKTMFWYNFLRFGRLV